MAKRSYAKGGMTIESAGPDDVPLLLELIEEVAVSLNVRQNFFNTPDNLRNAILAEPPLFEAVIVRQDGQPAGFACWYLFYRPFSGLLTFCLDYIYVRPDYRQHPVAMALLMYVLLLAKAKGCKNLYGTAVRTNTRAQYLYRMMGAKEIDYVNFSLELADVDWAKVDQILPLD